MVCMNVLAKIQKVVVCVGSWKHVSINIYYESKIWFFSLYENSSYHSNKNGCFSCSEHRYFFLLSKENRFLALCSHCHVTFLFWSMSWKLFTFFSYHLRRARSKILNMAGLCNKKIEEDKTDSMLWLDFNKVFKNW